MSNTLKISAVLFPGFELLDLFGPLEMFGMLNGIGHPVSITLLAQGGGAVASAQGPRACADVAFGDAPAADILLVPGGQGTRALVKDGGFLAALRGLGATARILASVCTGSALLAKAGLLDGKAATSNKLAFDWATAQSARVRWIRHARWVEDGNVFTSSGVSAGIDMSLALIAHVFDEATARKVARQAEYTWHEDSADDPFATLSA